MQLEPLMKSIYLLSSVVGGTILVVQTVLLVLGIGADHDMDVDSGGIHDGGFAHDHSHAFDHDHSHAHSHDHGDDGDPAYGFLKLLSLKTLVAFITFFGLAGLASLYGGFGPVSTLIVAFCTGCIALYIVAYLMAALSRLQSSGTLDLRNAVGQKGTVYLGVPSNRGGAGKVTLAVQGRRIEVKAVTVGDALPTGAEVRVVAMSGPDSVEVVAEQGAQAKKE